MADETPKNKRGCMDIAFYVVAFFVVIAIIGSLTSDPVSSDKKINLSAGCDGSAGQVIQRLQDAQLITSHGLGPHGSKRYRITVSPYQWNNLQYEVRENMLKLSATCLSSVHASEVVDSYSGKKLASWGAMSHYKSHE